MNKVLVASTLILVLPGAILLGGFMYLTNRIETMEKLHVTRSFTTLSPLPSLTNSAGDSIEVTSIDPMPPVEMDSGKYVTISFKYKLVSASQVCIFARALKNGEDMTASGGSDGSPPYLRGSGTGKYTYMKDGPCDSDEVELFMSLNEPGPFLFALHWLGRMATDRRLRILTLKFPAFHTWKAP